MFYFRLKFNEYSKPLSLSAGLIGALFFWALPIFSLNTTITYILVKYGEIFSYHISTNSFRKRGLRQAFFQLSLLTDKLGLSDTHRILLLGYSDIW
jgi:hypothetical protein